MGFAFAFAFDFDFALAFRLLTPDSVASDFHFCETSELILQIQLQPAWRLGGDSLPEER